MLKADQYYGATASGYEARRKHKGAWRLEQEAVEAMVGKGPVLDCPVGTGRYLPIYEAKGLDWTGVDISKDMLAEARKVSPKGDLRLGSVFNLPFEDGAFRTVVCSRLVNWLYPQDMHRAITELRRVGRNLVLSIILDKQPGQRNGKGNYIHTRHDFYRAIDGLLIAERRDILAESDRLFSMFHLRRAKWADVLDQFAEREDPLADINRLTLVWTKRYGLRQVFPERGKVRAEFWPADRLGTLVDYMAAVAVRSKARHDMITDQMPRQFNRPPVIVKIDSHHALIDGRRRLNQWRKHAGLYQVLVVDCSDQLD